MKSNYRQGKNSGMMVMLLTMLTVVIVLAGASVGAQGQTPTVIYSFPAYNGDVCEPEGFLVQGRDGYMYGTGGCSSNGGVYKISPTGVESVVAGFPTGWAGCASGLTLGNDGNFYGTCQSGNPATNAWQSFSG